MFFFPPLQLLLHSLLVVVLTTLAHLFVDGNMTRDAEGHEVAGVEAETLHFFDAPSTLHRADVMNVDSCPDITSALAHLAKGVVLQFPHSELSPSLGVEQSLVVLISAHRPRP